jgi:L-asparaginase II
MDAEVLVEFTRGPLVEAVHRGHIAVVDVHGRMQAWVGDPEAVSYLRSAAKPLQLLPLLEDRLDERFGFQDDELAVMAASHSGEERHVQAVSRILERIGLDRTFLRCGVHPPVSESTRRRLHLLGALPTPLHNNCSGKHAAMLTMAVAGGHPLDSYTELSHPVQQRIVQVIREMSGVAEPIIGVDGCGVPVFGMPLRAMAYAYARLIDPRDLPAGRALACRRVAEVMRAYPGMVSGEGRLEEALMPASGGRLLLKSGAEGLYALGIPAEVSPGGEGWGLVLKMEDGSAGERAIGPALLEALSQLGVLTPEQRASLSRFDFGPIYNHRHEEVGESRPAFSLHRA